MTLTTRELYNRSNHHWARNEPVLLSDYTARPFLLEWSHPLEGADVVDIGCGEGYFARQLKKEGANRVHAIDISEEMINRAMEQEAAEELGIEYSTGGATDLGSLDDASFDVAVAMFLFNYLTVEQSVRAMQEVRRVLRKGGRFIFAVPHPSLPFLRDEQPPFFFSRGGAGYFSGRDSQLEGKIWRRDGEAVAVRCVHKTVEDYFLALRRSGFDKLPDIKELHVTESILEVDPDFFAPLMDQPLHLAFQVEK